VGKPSTPTPAGRFAVLSVTPNDPNTFDGAWVLALTAESDALQRFGGGPGRIGLHGRGGASLADPLGSAASHGCIRFANAAVRWIVAAVGASNLPGVPVVVR
jgi:lipoprotein-anchoring transpeptidase ErfK/SrfK